MLSGEREIELKTFLSELEIEFDDLKILNKALTHSSYTHEQKLPSSLNNERLEFLGDAVLKLISSDYLYERFEDYSEGELTKIRSILVSDKILTTLGEKVNIQKYIKLGFHEEKSGGRNRPSTIACAFEAMLGAFYVSGKYAETKKLLIRLIEDDVTIIDNSEAKFNYKAMLQEYAQANALSLPDYVLSKEEGPSHNKLFEIEVYLADKMLGKGDGKSKKQAQQNAAHEALIELKLVEK